MLNKILLTFIGVAFSAAAMEDQRNYQYQNNDQLNAAIAEMSDKRQLIIGGCTSLGGTNFREYGDTPTLGIPISEISQLWDKTKLPGEAAPGNCLTGNIQVESGAHFYCDAFKPWETIALFPCLSAAGFERVLLNFVDQEPLFNISMNALLHFDKTSYDSIIGQNAYNQYVERFAKNIPPQTFQQLQGPNYLARINLPGLRQAFRHQISTAMGQSFALWVNMLKPGGRFEYRSFEFPAGERFSQIQGSDFWDKLQGVNYVINNQTYPVHGRDANSKFTRKMQCYNLLSTTSPFLNDSVVNIYKDSLINAGLDPLSISIDFVYSPESLIDAAGLCVASSTSCFLRFQGKKPAADRKESSQTV